MKSPILGHKSQTIIECYLHTFLLCCGSKSHAPLGAHTQKQIIANR
jgi:hypothetical protein